jgi:hypothetical protein
MSSSFFFFFFYLNERGETWEWEWGRREEGGGRREEVVSFYGTFSSYIKQTGLYQIIVDTDLNLFLLKKKKTRYVYSPTGPLCQTYIISLYLIISSL